MATKFGRRAPLEVENYTYENLRSWLDRSRENLGVDDGRSRPAALPAVGDLLHAGGLRSLRPARGGRARPRLWGQRREGRGGAEGDRVPGRLDGADHLQHLPPAAGRALLRAGAPARRRRDRPRSAGLWAADRQVRPRVELRCRTTIAPSTATASASTRARRSPASTSSAASRSSTSCGRSCRRARRWRSLRCAGSSASTRSRRSSRAQDARAGARERGRGRPTAAARGRRCRRSQRSTASGSRRKSITAGSPS